MLIKNKTFRKLMKEAGLEKVQLEKDNSCFSIISNDEILDTKIYLMETSLILANSFKQMSSEKWVEVIKEMFDDVTDENIKDFNNIDLDKPIVIHERWQGRKV